MGVNIVKMFLPCMLTVMGLYKKCCSVYTVNCGMHTACIVLYMCMKHNLSAVIPIRTTHYFSLTVPCCH